MTRKVYLGDGIRETNRIVLEPEIIAGLVLFIERLKEKQ